MSRTIDCRVVGVSSGGRRGTLDPVQKYGVSHQAQNKHHSVQATDLPVENHDQQQGRHTDHNGNVQPDEPAGYGERPDECCDTENEENVQDVAAHDVSYGEVGASFEDCLDADYELGEACAVGNDSEADDDGGNAENSRDPRRTSHKETRSDNQKGKSDHDGDDFKGAHVRYSFVRAVQPSHHPSPSFGEAATNGVKTGRDNPGCATLILSSDIISWSADNSKDWYTGPWTPSPITSSGIWKTSMSSSRTGRPRSSSAAI